MIYIILAGVIFFEMCNCMYLPTCIVWKINEKYLGNNMISDYNIYNNILLKIIQIIVYVVFV